MHKKNPINLPYTLILVEGDTEFLFYNRIKKDFFPKAKSKARNLKGNWNINTKVLDYVTLHLEEHPNTEFIVCICIDRESRDGMAPIQMDIIRKELSLYKNIRQKNIKLFEAVQDIESWFFHDVDGIFKFLRLPGKQRTKSKYLPVEKLNHENLSRLFKQANKEYRKGDASRNFINKLDLKVIRGESKVLNAFCNFMEKIYL